MKLERIIIIIIIYLPNPKHITGSFKDSNGNSVQYDESFVVFSILSAASATITVQIGYY